MVLLNGFGSVKVMCTEHLKNVKKIIHPRLLYYILSGYAYFSRDPLSYGTSKRQSITYDTLANTYLNWL